MELNMLTFGQYYNMKASQFKTDDAVSVKCVAVIGYGETWAAYMGLSSWTDAEVADGGDKMDSGAAARLFPTIAARFEWRA
jgi:hypothetical protein